MTLLKIERVSARYTVHDTSRKRRLETIDMDLRKKQELLTDLQVFFAEGTEDYYWQNGTPYRRGYMFNGPAGTGKTSLSTAIASHYNLPLCVIDLAGMDDTILQDKVKHLPPRCVILFEDIDAAGIVRERTMMPKTDASDEEDETLPESESSDTWDPKPRATEPKKVDPKNINPLPPPSRTKITLSGLLNTLDGPGSREGHIVILTTNAPDSLDEALYRPGRIDTQVYLGFADQITAAITFARIFGSDKHVKESQKEIRKLGRAFGRLVPSNFFTPAEIQKFCMNRRGQPQKAVNEFPEYINEKRTGKTKFQYDIHRRATVPTFHEKEDTHDGDISSDEAEDTARGCEESAQGARDPSLELSRIFPIETSAKRHVKEQLFIAHGDEHDDDPLAYGDYHPHKQGIWEDRLADDVATTCRRLKDMLTFPTGEPSQYRSVPNQEYRLQDLVVPAFSMKEGQLMSLSGTHCATESSEPRVLCKPGIRPRQLSREHHYQRPNGIEEMNMPNLDPRTTVKPPLPRLRPDATTLVESRAASPSPTGLTEASVYYTPLSVGEQLEQTFQHHRRPSHPEFIGRRNLHPYHGPLPCTAEEGAWVGEASPKSATVLLRNVDPRPVEDFEQPRLAGRDHDAVD
ncbi:hypothetical protein ACET3X_007819 [Alternaria dauci]|uniref:AAA+ ATPase domain-containing protein n=1 Tax=Alternaria dauci TaxID=48095 RepID=A0ABR3UEI7_9PLEO